MRKSYEWGSTRAMQDFLGEPHDGGVLAEVWFGSHHSAPSPIDGHGPHATLQDLIASDPAGALGVHLAEMSSALPYLLKLLAPGHAVSLQVHPGRGLAERGFEAEERAGIPLSASRRTYKDANHKPEMVYALTRFEGLIGFRSTAEARYLLRPLVCEIAQKMYRTLSPANDPEAMRSALHMAISETTSDEIERLTSECAKLAQNQSDGYQTVVDLAAMYPGDVGVVASLLMRRVRLAPGAAAFVPDGMPHTYISGLGVELMANSDNVIRAGLTSKHVDADALLEAIDMTARYSPLRSFRDEASCAAIFAPHAAEFALAVADVGDVDVVTLPGAGPRMVLAVGGTVMVRCDGESLELERGQAAFVSDCEGPVRVTGVGRVVEAFVPDIGHVRDVARPRLTALSSRSAYDAVTAPPIVGAEHAASRTVSVLNA